MLPASGSTCGNDNNSVTLDLWLNMRLEPHCRALFLKTFNFLNYTAGKHPVTETAG
jgi:hypothetical protein